MTQVAEVGEQGAACFSSAKPVQRRVGEDPLKQHWQFLRRFFSVMLCQFHHAVLNDVERGFIIPDMVERAFEGTLFYAC